MLSLFGCSSNNIKPSDNPINNSSSDNESNNSIVVYFSRTNNTENVANYIVDVTNSSSYEILAKIPYTDDDIKYYTDCKADREQNDPNARPEIGSEAKDLTDYDIILFRISYLAWTSTKDNVDIC